MTVFSKEVALKHFGGLWRKMIAETDFGVKLKEQDLSIMFICSEPDAIMYVSADGPLLDDETKDKTATVTMSMSTNTAHLFWLKKLNVPKALALRQIRAKGPVGKILQLLPLLKPGQAMYPEYCKQNGIPTE